ncbi:hypothetical protein B0H66DRAFT_166748 [Apodospora peruviana]|uniref:BZIP domain-containing protein n=1 Tax=Apodospora peruviana TaxID=516989 RepID=A0AAE0IKU7_9PEZI|nr:hypothetical protein B0H66DRAFT_166748 [Apodospora peruviana]
MATVDTAPPLAPANGSNFSPGPDVSLKITTTLAAAAVSSPGAAIYPTSATSPASDVSTPSSAASTTSTTVPRIAIRPNTATRPTSIRTNTMATLSADSPSQPLSMTSKEWVVPPRPKPGRKPATDTPPTKRKAQNRAAQRAFRERRAARVGELEEQLDEQKEEHDRTVRELQGRINRLENEAEILQSRCQWLEKSLEEERQARENAERNWDHSQQTVLALNPDDINPTQTQPPSRVTRPLQPILPAPRPVPAETVGPAESLVSAQSFSISQIISPPEEVDAIMDFTCGACQSTGPCSCVDDVLQDSNFTLGCGGCSIGSRCACLEESIRQSIAADLKRPRASSPSSMGPEEKRHRTDDGSDSLETDFTALIASPSKHAVTQPELQPLASVESRESCGFCKEGTYCYCADPKILAAAAAASSSTVQAAATAAQPMTAQQTHTPPPSEDDVVPAPMEVTATGAIKLPSMRQGRVAAQPVRTGGCGPNGPGTCAQCLADPKSGLFCRSLAANFERNNLQQQADGSSSSSYAASGCCGNGGPGGCCKAGMSGDGSNAATATAVARKPDTSLGLSLSCADAYKTLASHRNFDEAADDIGSWLPKLRAAPIPKHHAAEHGRGSLSHISSRWAPIEVEAASIMTVLKDFDVRFGRGE